MTVVEGPIPSVSLLYGPSSQAAYFMDSYSARLTNGEVGPAGLFHHLFSHHPWWAKAILVARNTVARWFGLAVPTAQDILATKVRDHYAVGDTIGPWPIFALTDTELIAGRNNPHLDFRLSVLKHSVEGVPRVSVTTICLVNHWSGRLYLFFVVPFHRWGVRKLIANAVAAGRL
jgi:Protein of unknown function (DUF2867)